MTRAMRAGAATRQGPRVEAGAPMAGAPARAQVEQALEVLLGAPVSLLCANDACRLSLHFRTMDELETLLHTLVAARAREASGAAMPAAPPPGSARALRLVSTAGSDDAAAARNKARNVAAYGPRPDPVRQ